MKIKSVLSTVLTTILILIIMSAVASAHDGCSIECDPEAQSAGDPLSYVIDDILADGESVFLFFYADWCSQCHHQMPIIDELEAECAGEVTFIKINVTARPDHAKEFEVNALPTMVVISGEDGDEYVKEEISGFAEATELSAIIVPREGSEDGVTVTALGVKCNSCSDCTKKLNGDYGIVALTTDLINVKGSCIIFGANNVVFDGDGHKIDGDDTGEFESGIAMTSKTGNTIKNCVITDFESGITLHGSSGNEIYGNEISSNYYDGIWIDDSDSNNIHDNLIEDNGKYGVYFTSDSNSNTFSKNTVCSNPTDVYDADKNFGDENACDTTHNWTDAGTQGCTHDCTVKKPDLLITDISNDGATICYTIKNIGDATAQNGHYTTLFVDGAYQIKEQVDVDMAPGASVKRCFDHYSWECTPPEDKLKVCADYGDGVVSLSYRWDSTGFEPGNYLFEVALRDPNGTLLDRKTEMFRLGISSGEIASFTATPECFDIGDAIGIKMAFENTGTVNITGTAIIRVLNSTGYATEEFRHNVTNVTPSGSISFSDEGDTSGAEAGSSYRVIGYVLYDSKSTDPATVTVRNLIMGDLNRDGEVTTADAAIALELAASGEYDRSGRQLRRRGHLARCADDPAGCGW